jgi:hypothetical protein
MYLCSKLIMIEIKLNAGWTSRIVPLLERFQIPYESTTIKLSDVGDRSLFPCLI